MSATRTRTVVLLVLLVLAQWLGSVHDVSHVSGVDHQACGQCLHGKAKQHAAPAHSPADADPAATPVPEALAAATPQVIRHYRSPPRGPPPVS